MTKNRIILLLLALALLFACGSDKTIAPDNGDDDNGDGNGGNKPTELTPMELVAKYGSLISYVDFKENSEFMLSAAAGIYEYAEQGAIFRLINSNFNELRLPWESKHGGVVQDDGSLNFRMLNDLFRVTAPSKVNPKGIHVFGHTLCWHANQNATYLRSIIPTGKIEYDPNDDRPNYVKNSSLDLNSNGWGWWCWVDNESKGGGQPNVGVVGGGMKFTHSSDEGFPWTAQIRADFSPAPVPRGEYTLSFFIKSDNSAKFRCSTYAGDGVENDVQYQTEVEIDSKWQYVEWDISSSGYLLGVNFDVGFMPGTYYIDEVRLNPRDVSNEYNKPKIVVQPPTVQEKAQIVEDALETWIEGMVNYCKPHIRAWDVVNEPMDDWPDPSKLKTAQGREKVLPDEFFWQDYLGKDYAVKAFKMARKYGGEDSKYFINEYGIEHSLEKCQGLIDFVKYIESQGAKVDGIGSQMHTHRNADRAIIAESFKMLAATGKLIYLSEFDIAMGKTPLTEEEKWEQADLFQYIVESYFKYIPAEQRYGIFAPLHDTPIDGGWLPGEQQGLHDEKLNRKPAYAGFANGLAGRDISEDFK